MYKIYQWIGDNVDMEEDKYKFINSEIFETVLEE